MLRKMDVSLQGYENALNSDNPMMRDHKSVFFKKQSAFLWTLLNAQERFAPNGVVRRRVLKIDEKYRDPGAQN